MMNFKQTWKLAALSLAALATIHGCSNDDFDNASSQGQTVITAGFEQPGANTRTAVNSNQVVWLRGDAFKLFYTQAGGSDGSSVFTTSDDTKQTSASFTGTALPAGATATYAVYPAANVSSLSSSTVTMTLPATFAASEASNGPMVANAGSDYTNLSFKHLCGLLKLTVTNLPTSAKQFVVSATENIAGTATADLSQNNPALTLNTSGASSSVTVTSIDVDANGTQQTFYIPIPVGTYTNLTAKITDASGAAIAKYKDKVWSSVTVARAQMLHATFGFDIVVDASAENISSQIQANAPTTAPTEESTTTILVSGSIVTTNPSHQNAEIKVPVVQNSNISLILDAVPQTTTAKPLKITATDATGMQTPAETSTNVTTVAIPDIADKTFAPSLEVTTPNSTTELAATDETKGATFNVVTALTAKNTLVINKGVKVKEIIVKGGNILIKSGAKVEKITKSWSGSDKCIVYVETGATYPNDLSAEDFDVQYTDMAGILKNGGTLTLDKDIELTEPMVVEADVTLDLNGHTITATNSVNSNIQVTGKLTLKDTKGTGKILANADYTPGTSGYSYGLIIVNGENALMVMEGGTINAVRSDPANKGQYGVTVLNGGDFTMKGGKIEAGWYAVSGNGNYATQNSVITIEGGELISTADYAIYLPQSGTTTIKDGKVNGAAGGVAIQRGILNIEGGEILSTDEGNTGSWNDGTGGLGNSALIVAGEYGDCTVNISGGTISSQKKAALIENPSSTHTKTIAVTGGTFSDPSVVTNYLAQGANVNVKLNKDYTGPGFGLYYGGYGKGATIVVDLNNKTWNVEDTPLFGSTGYESQYFHLEKDTKVTFKNGTIQPKDNGGKMMIQNYCDLTLENVSVIGGTNCSYVVSNNNGKCDINNSTITATGDNCAFDVYSFNKYAGVTVTINGSSVINGKVEFGGNNNQQNGTLIVNGGTLKGNLVVTDGYVKSDKSNLQVNGGTWGSYTGWETYKTSSYKAE